MRKFDDKKMVQNPASWPCWPLLPLKRRKGNGEWPDLGFVVEAEGHYPKLSNGKITLFAEPMPYEPKDLKDIKQVTYDSVDALLADGWIVD